MPGRFRNWAILPWMTSRELALTSKEIEENTISANILNRIAALGLDNMTLFILTSSSKCPFKLSFFFVLWAESAILSRPEQHFRNIAHPNQFAIAVFTGKRAEESRGQ